MRNLLIPSLLALAWLSSPIVAQEKQPAKATVAQLLKDLKQTGDVDTRVQAAVALADYGPAAEPAVPALVAALGSKNEDLRLNAAIALGKIGKASVPPLTELLEGTDKDARFYAIWALGWVGPDAKDVAPALVRAMADKDEGIRRKAAYALGRIAANPQQTMAVLLAAFKDANEDVRQAASDALAKFGTDAVPGILAALKDGDVKVRLQAAHAVTEMGTDAKDTAPVLRDLLLGKEVDNHAYIYAQALAKLGKAGVPALIEGFKDERPNVSQACVQSLSGVGADAVPALVDALGEKKVTVRRLAAQVLMPMRVSDKMVVTALAYAVTNDQDDQVRQLCVQALSMLGISGKLGVPALQHALADANNDVRVQAFYALQNMGENPRAGFLKALASKDDNIRINTAGLMLQVNFEPNSAVPVLVEALKHQKDAARIIAALALAQSGREAGKLLPFFKEHLKGDTASRIYALRGLAFLNQQAAPAVAEVIDALKDTDSTVRHEAVVALRSIPSNSDAILPALTRVFKEDKGQIRFTIVQMIPRFGPKGMPLLLEAIKDSDASIRQQAVWAMQSTGGDLSQYHEAILALVKDKDANVRSIVINILGRTGEKGVMQLGDMLKDPSEQVRWQAAQALQQLGKGAIKALPALAEALHDKNQNVRNHAVYALAQIGEEGAKVLTKTFSESKDAQLRNQLLQTMLYTQARAHAVPLLKLAVHDPDKDVRQSSIQMLPNLGQTQEVFDLLAEALKDKELSVRLTAVYTLQNLGPKGMSLLEQGLTSAKEAQMRQAILQGLINYKHQTKTMVGPLIEFLKDGQPQVRSQAAQVLGNIGADAKDALPMLKELVNDTNITVRQQAQAAINRIEPPKE
jgi:HEAT repeat protein